MDSLSARDFCRLVDHTLLKSTATVQEIEKLCQEAIQNHFFAICINPFYVSRCHEILKGSPVKLATVCDFPLGVGSIQAAIGACEVSLSEGADEVDMVINVGALKSGDLKTVERQIGSLKRACNDKILKVILETCLLTPKEIETACAISKDQGADFVKTSTGFSTGGATVEAVALMRKAFGGEVKASGGIRNAEQATAMVRAGATRLGLSASVSILEEIRLKENSK